MNAAFSHGCPIAARPALLRRSATVCGETIRAALAVWGARRRERAELATMTQSELRDAGITPYEARFEARKPFWRA